MSTTSNNLLIKNLTDFGLSDKEAKIYLALLELEIAPVQDVAKVAGINRSSAYVVLESLKKQGLVSVSDDKKIQQYIATPPEVLLQTAESRSKNQLVIKERIADILPDLKALYKGTKQKPKVRVFEGKQGLITALAETLNSKDKITRIISSCEKILAVIPEFLPEFGKVRLGYGIRHRAIYPECKAAEKILSMSPKLYDGVVIPKEDYPFSADIAIFDDKIGFVSFNNNEVTTIIIENKEIAEIMVGLFEFTWKEAERIVKKCQKDKLNFYDYSK